VIIFNNETFRCNKECRVTGRKYGGQNVIQDYITISWAATLACPAGALTLPEMCDVDELTELDA
jgi:hypothetical protein